VRKMEKNLHGIIPRTSSAVVRPKSAMQMPTVVIKKKYSLR
jgi:hypothetical protein